MKLIYSTDYVGNSHIELANETSLIGTKVCGSMELLDELELRAGIVVPDISTPEHIVLYGEAVKAGCKNTLFERSYNIDPMGVTRQLMSWRENLLMENWNPNQTQCTEKLEALAQIEHHASDNPIGKRWNVLCKYANAHALLSDKDEIEVHVSENELPAVIRNTLIEISRTANVVYKVPTEPLRDDSDLGKIQKYLAGNGHCETLGGDGSVKFYHFKTRMMAYEWFLSQVSKDGMGKNVYINSDNNLLSNLAYARKCPMVYAVSKKSNSQILQLFKLGLSLFSRPLNVYNLLSYLQTPKNPLGSIARLLARILVKEGGVNETWHQAVETYIMQGERSDKQKLKFINMVTREYDKENIPTQDVIEYTNALGQWANLKLHSNDSVGEGIIEQYVALGSYCRSLAQLVKDKDGISAEELNTLVEGIYRPCSITLYTAEKNSPEIIDSIFDLVEPTDGVCWLDCVEEPYQEYPFSFLNNAEIDSLRNDDVLIPSKSEFFNLRRKRLILSLMKVRKELTLVSWDFDSNTRVGQNPVWIELQSIWKEKGWDKCLFENEKPYFKTVETQIKPLSVLENCKLNSSLLKKRCRQEESYSSLEKMIQFPFDYTMDYLLNLKKAEIGQLPDISQTEGIVAHSVVESLVNSFGKDMPKRCLELSEKEFTDFLEKAICQKGAVLLLPEYRLDKQLFENKIKDSIKSLSLVMQELKLSPQACEVDMNVNLGRIGPFLARVDMVLTDEKGRYVLFDFKWSESKMYEEKLKQNDTVQLELYRQAAKLHFGNDSEIAGVAYYLFPKCKLYTSDFPASDHVIHIDVKSDCADRRLYEELQHSYHYRRNEIENGELEIMECVPLEEIPYQQHIDDDKLYPLYGDYNNKKVKASPYIQANKPPFSTTTMSWGKHSDDVQKIPTTHPILKGRLS